jgi:predicted transcriptional regulator
VDPGEIATIVRSIHEALGRAEQGGSAEPESPRLTSAQVRKSITPDALISFEDGRRYKALRRHLAKYGLTPQQYRSKWGLPGDYPMVSLNYSQARSKMAKAVGLGR